MGLKIFIFRFIENPYKFIEKLDLLVCPSLIDGFGRTLINPWLSKHCYCIKSWWYRDIIETIIMVYYLIQIKVLKQK